ncbi:putative ACR, COG1678, putative [Trypanosoma equiperdum]|uniref:Uncharacterized protein n=2 Tax=Trypanozoon TaxID=39700 RepID=Q385Y5_TRYB2|nr:hypothetical protein, conserved [Trypanosoma brucei brucei TREU927]EAN79396.1 hypothetical protein, conserved [Trypanosoma brucei brucei TREU927]SCU70007.1 Uncharacterized ACR, COG1678, putative [Trypanosoma equiperdum]
MEKIVRTVYKQLYKKASQVEKDVAMRTALTCSPRRVYDHRCGKWVPMDVAKLSGWHETRVFVDALVRRLNGGREFFIPLANNGGGDANNTGMEAKSPSMVDILRQSFESTPFTSTQIGNAFAALRELANVTDTAVKYSNSVAPPPEEVRSVPTPKLTVVSAVEGMHHLSLTRGLSEVLEGVPYEDMGVSRTSEEDVHTEGKAETKDTSSEEGVISEEESDDRSSNKKATFDTPKKAQLLLAHPQLYDFFRYTVMIVVRVTPNESAALVLNKPLENDKGALMPVSMTMRLSSAHPLFAKHLCNHTVMIGGPVSRGSFDSTMLLLHRIPDVDDAIPLSHSLWIDGSYDTLQQKIEDGTADPKDIVVICGFSGWGVQQLEGELQSGTWVAASGSTDDPALDNFVFTIARLAGTHGPSPVASDPSPTGEGNEAPSATSMEERNRWRRASLWAWAYSALGQPFASMAGNQKPFMHAPPDA